MLLFNIFKKVCKAFADKEQHWVHHTSVKLFFRWVLCTPLPKCSTVLDKTNHKAGVLGTRRNYWRTCRTIIASRIGGPTLLEGIPNPFHDSYRAPLKISTSHNCLILSRLRNITVGAVRSRKVIKVALPCENWKGYKCRGYNCQFKFRWPCHWIWIRPNAERDCGGRSRAVS